jgi:hypothetical protein
MRFREALAKRLSGFRGLLTRAKGASYLLSLAWERVKLLFTPQRRNVLTHDLEGRLPITHDWNIYLKERPPEWEEAVRVTELAIIKFRDEVRHNGSNFLLLTLTNGAQLSDKLLPDLNRGLGKGNYDLEKPDSEIRRLSKEKGVDVF